MTEIFDTKYEKLTPMSDEQFIDHLKSRPKEVKINTSPQKKVDTINLQFKSNLPDFSTIKQRKDDEILDELKKTNIELEKVNQIQVKEIDRLKSIKDRTLQIEIVVGVICLIIGHFMSDIVSFIKNILPF